MRPASHSHGPTPCRGRDRRITGFLSASTGQQAHSDSRRAREASATLFLKEAKVRAAVGATDHGCSRKGKVRFSRRPGK